MRNLWMGGVIFKLVRIMIDKIMYLPIFELRI